MPSKIYTSAVTGLTPTLHFYNGSVETTSTSATEIGTTGEYLSNIPADLPAGNYLIIVTVGTDVKIASGSLYWDGVMPVSQMIDELHKIQGLDQNNPMTVTPTSRTAASINLSISGDGTTSTTVTRE